MQTQAVAPWRFFTCDVRAVRQLSPSFRRITVGGDALARFADNGYDQRIKVVLPLPDSGLTHLPDGPDWYASWRALPDERRNPIRTYTVRAVRAYAGEVDIDFAMHGDGGPASRWAGRARPGDAVAILGPDAAHDGEHGGVEFRPPSHASCLLLAGDETAVPAICSILERLPADARGEALLEVPHADDRWPVTAPAGMAVTWLPRSGGAHGGRLVPAVTAAAERLLTVGGVTGSGVTGDVELVDVDVDRDILWEVPVARATAAPYAWLAGEAGVIRALRRHLVSERGYDRGSVAFMGYWRLGRSDQL